jgi:hypothetical protein
LQKPMFRNASEMKKLKAESLYREILQLSIWQN